MLCSQFCLTYINCHFFTDKQFPKSNYVSSVQRFSCCYDVKHTGWLIKFIENALYELWVGMNKVCIHIQCKLANMKTNATVISKQARTLQIYDDIRIDLNWYVYWLEILFSEKRNYWLEQNWCELEFNVYKMTKLG